MNVQEHGCVNLKYRSHDQIKKVLISHKSKVITVMHYEGWILYKYSSINFAILAGLSNCLSLEQLEKE
jgi:hypothetical protein